jgi:RHS repeat-associated protein
LLSHTDALQRRTCWAYNVAGLIATRTDAQGHTLDYRWDRLGRLLELRNENHSSARFSYDSMGRLLSETGFDGKRRSYHYHAESGVLAQQLDEDRIIEFAFDPLGRLSQRHAGHRHGQHWQSEAFHYDGNGQLLMAENSQSKLQWFYDRAGNLSREHQYYRFLDTPSVAIWQHEYDALNQRCATTRPDGHRVSWLTYGSGHLLAIKLDDAELLSYQRDALHREIGRVQGNGLQQRQQWTANGYLHTQSLTRPGSNDYLRKRQHHYDPAGQLTAIDDSNRGTLSYRYDPLNRLLGAHSRLGAETFAFDPASNLLDPHEAPQANGLKRSRQMDNLLHQYLGNHYRYDPRGNLSERWLDGQHGRFTWDLYDRLVGYEDARLKVNYGYDALGRRLYKQSAAKYQDRAQAGPLWNRKQRLDLDERYGCKSSIYGWDGDHLAFESTYHPRGERTTHYLYEPGTFVPLVQASYEQQIALLPEPSYDGPYDIDQDPVWQYQPQAPAFKALDWYQCDHLGTPLELTDQHGEMVWRADYQAWGQAQVRLSEAAQRRKLDTALRFQGQYLDVETGLHYNRYRYYDPQVGRFVSADPIGYAGGLNLYQYAPNAVEWVDPLGLASNRDFRPTANLDRKLSALQNAQSTSERERILPDGRVRYYEKEKLSRTPGPTRGRSHATEYNPRTGQVRAWEETYDHSGKINRVHPKMNNGKQLNLPHYPPTKADIDQGLATPNGRAITCGCLK